MSHFPLLSVVTFLPLVGAFFIILFIPKTGDEAQYQKNVKNTALFITVMTFLLSLVVWHQFDPSASGMQLTESFRWIDGLGIGYELGIDGISIFFILLTTLLMPLCILASWNSITHQIRNYMVAFLALETLILGIFVSMDFLMFYFFFEASLIPMFLIIGIWGGENRIYAAFKFFLYTFLGSVLLLLALIYIYKQFGTTHIPTLMEQVPSLPLHIQSWLWFAFFASFAVKVPMWPFHTWLPDAHVQAPTAGSMILAGILLKLGGYGFLRFSLPMLPDASVLYAPFIYWLSIAAVIYTSLVALVQEDMKKLIAYSSIAHMGFVTAGIFALNQQAIEGAIFQMLSHGFVSAALFFAVGVLYDRAHTKKIEFYGGLVHRMPRFAFYFMLFTMASIGLPGTSGFVGEFMILLGVFQDSKVVAALVTTGVIFGAGYMLWLYRRVVFGELTNKKLKNIADIDRRETMIFVSLAILTIIFGIYPLALIEDMHTSVLQLITSMEVR